MSDELARLPLDLGSQGKGAAGPPVAYRAAAYDVLFAAEWPSVVGYLRRGIRDWSLAEDLAQETFLRAAQGLAAFRGESSPRTWLRRIAANVLRDHWRGRASQEATILTPLPPEDTLEIADRGASPALTLERREIQTCLSGMLAQLSATEREALALAIGDAATPRDIARRLGVSSEVVRARLHRARRKLGVLAGARCVLATDEGGTLSCEARGLDAIATAPLPQPVLPT